jgi:hypothetical protein
MKKIATTLGIALVATACAGGQSRTDGPFDQGPEASGRITVVVDNLQFNDATLYALANGGSRTRIGTVSGKNRGTMRVNWERPRELRIEIRLLAGERFTTTGLNVTAGERVDLTIQNPLNRSILRRSGGR